MYAVSLFGFVGIEPMRSLMNVGAFYSAVVCLWAADFLPSFQSSLPEWQELYNSPEPQNAQLPEPWHADTTEFQKMMIVRCIRPDKVRRPRGCLISNRVMSFY